MIRDEIIRNRGSRGVTGAVIEARAASFGKNPRRGGSPPRERIRIRTDQRWDWRVQITDSGEVAAFVA